MATLPIGLDISATSMAATVLRRKGKAYQVQQVAEGPVPPGAVVDGEVHDAAALGAAIKSLWDEHSLKGKRVAIGIANQRCIVRVFDMPKIKAKKDLQEAIGFEVEDNLPVPPEEACWDFHTVETYKDSDTGADRQKHVVVMTYRESMERWREAIEAAGLKVAYIDLAAAALMRAGLQGVELAMATEDHAEDDGPPVVALLDVGATATNVVVSRGGACELNRIVAFGTSHFSSTLAEQFSWSEEDSVRVRDEVGIVPAPGTPAAGEAYADARRVLKYVAEQFAQEIRTSFDYYAHSSGGSSRVGRVVVAGEGALLQGIETVLAEEIGVPVSVLDASPRLDPGSLEQLGARHPRYGTALGLAMEDAA